MYTALRVASHVDYRLVILVCIAVRVCVLRSVGGRKLVRLTTCYDRVFRRQCGLTAGRLVAGLMARAFADPHYQRYRYRPDCQLHRRRLTVPRRPSSGGQRCRSVESVAVRHHPVDVILVTALVVASLVASSS